MKPRHKLLYFERDALDLWLSDKPELREICAAKEAIYRFRPRSQGLARISDALAHSNLPELKRFGRTLKS